MQSKVVIKHGLDPSILAYKAIAEVFEGIIEGKKVLLKPNAARVGSAKSGLCTHPEVIRGLINYFQKKGASDVFVGDSPIFGVDQWEALSTSGIKEICEQTGAICVNLDDYSFHTLPIPNGIIVDSLKITSFLKEVDIVVSVPVMKTHMYTGVTLSIKNMKGCLFKKEKSKLHRIFKDPPDKSKGRTLDFGLADMASVLLPHYAVIDGIVGMEGFGPGAGTPKNMNLVLASKNSIAADLVAIRLMGMEGDSISHLNLIKDRLKSIRIEEVIVEPENYMELSNKFELPTKEKLQIAYPNINIVEKGTCSACTNTILAFLKTHGKKFSKDFKFTLATGQDLQEEDLNEGQVFLVGSCTSSFKNKFPFCKGCPPVGSSILGLIRGDDTEVFEEDQSE